MERATALLELGRPHEAAAELHQALAQSPGDALLWRLLSQAHTDLDQYGQALEAARKAVVCAPEDYASHYALGVALWNMQVRGRRYNGLFAPARRASAPVIAALREALRLEPGDPSVHATLGRMLLLVGEEREAEALFQAALHVQPRYVEGQLGLATVALRRKQAQEAHDLASRVLEDEPLHTGAMQLLARASLMQGEANAAFTTAFAAVRLRPADRQGREQLETLIETYLPRPFGKHSPALRFLIVPPALPAALMVAAWVWLRTLYRLQRLRPGVRAQVVAARRRMVTRAP
ncbi:tetratricopeptide repeat protein [Deinococcus hopiensis]|uniref:tetratricopeptide repeat protein n=1 Tax=Deinococcus hopiensis TaxID=309885 RepID=UPI00148349DF|nr:tetratricopeptide repeat protein [Deinococcus hopiensis]